MTRIYRWLVWLYPADFRDEYGWLMVQVFDDLCHDARRTGGLFGLLGVWTRTLLDLTVTLPKEHLEAYGIRKTHIMDVTTFNNQMNNTVKTFIRDLRDGYSVVQCVERVSESAAEPTASEFKRLKEDVEAGSTWPQAFRHLQARVHSEPLERFIAVLDIQRLEGGNLADRLEEILNSF